MSKVLVTGASGFVGYHLIRRLLDRGDDVTCLVRSSSNTELLDQLDVRKARGDVTDRDSLARAIPGHDVVYHVAGCIRSFAYRTMFEINGAGPGNVARICAQQETPPRLVAVSSLAAAGPASRQHPKTENDPSHPISIYGRSKLLGEKMMRRYADRLAISIVRPGIVFGEADRSGLELFKPIARTRIHFSPGFRRKRYSVIHGTDLADLLILTCEHGTPITTSPRTPELAGRGIYFAACDEAPTFQEFGRMIGHALGCRYIVPLSFGPPMVYTVATIMELGGYMTGRPALLNRDKAHEGLSGPWWCANEKAKKELGFQIDVSLFERLKQTADWYREHKWL